MFDQIPSYLQVASWICTRERSDSVDSGFAEVDVKEEVSGTDGLRIITLDEVSYHCTEDDGWIVLYDKVYNMTEYIRASSHPAGNDVILEYLGYDATLAFRSVGHSKGAFRILQKFLIGHLPANERLGLSDEWT